MREEIINALVQLLNNNLGNRLTAELGTGIAMAVNQRFVELEITSGAESANGGSVLTC